MSLEARIIAILKAPMPGAAPQVRTSAAFAARFVAEANRSGLTVDLEEKDAGQLVRICASCGAQNLRYATACFNCQSDLDPRGPKAPPVAIRKKLHEARWLLIFATPLASRIPILKVPLCKARFAPPPTRPVTGAQVLSRFLSVFVEREKQPPPAVARFDERTMFDKFLSVFVEKQ